MNSILWEIKCIFRPFETVKNKNLSNDWFKITIHVVICMIIFLSMFAGVIKAEEKDDWSLAQFWGMGAFIAPLFYLLIYNFFFTRNIQKDSIVFKTNPQKNIERNLYYKEKQKIKIAYNKGLLQKIDYFCIIKYPIIGKKDNKIKSFHHNEDTSFLLEDEISKWIFYDSNELVVQPYIISPLKGWQKRVRQHWLGKYFIELPLNGWVWFYLKRPVEKYKI